jgi:hypothetical protein
LAIDFDVSLRDVRPLRANTRRFHTPRAITFIEPSLTLHMARAKT